MKVTYEQSVDAAYIYLTDEPLEPGRTTVAVHTDLSAMIHVDFKDGKMVGIEVIGASEVLHKDLLAHAEFPGVA